MSNRAVFLVSLVPALLLGGVAAVAQAQPSATATNWSDPASWPNNKVPVAGDKVTIGRDRNVILDVSPPALGGLSETGRSWWTGTPAPGSRLTSWFNAVHGTRHFRCPIEGPPSSTLCGCGSQLFGRRTPCASASRLAQRSSGTRTSRAGVI